MLLTLTTATALAFAVPDDAMADTGGCRGNRLTDHRPLDGEAAMPHNARLTIAVERDGCSSARMALEIDSDQGDSWNEELDVTSGLGFFLPDGGWEPGVTYAVAVFDDFEEDTDDEVFQGFLFTASEDAAPVVETPPELTIYGIDGVEQSRDYGVVEVDLHVSAQPDPQGLSLIQVLHTTTPWATKFNTGTGELEIPFSMSGVDPSTEEACFVARHIDATGEVTDGPEACAAILWEETGCGGCNSGLGVAGAGFLWCFVACLIAVRREGEG